MNNAILTPLYIMRMPRRKLPCAAKLVYSVIWTAADQHGLATLSLSDISKVIAVTKLAVVKSIQRLEALHLVSIDRTHKGHSNSYTIQDLVKGGFKERAKG